MVKTRLRAAAAIFIALAVALVSPAAVTAQAAGGCDCGSAPVVFLEGIASRDIMKNPGTAGEEVIFPPTIERIQAAISPDTALNLAKFAVTWDWDNLAEALIPAAEKALEDFGCNPDGSVKEGTGINWSYPAIGAHDPYSEYEFRYDWREDPMDIARDLKDYIDYVCAGTGHDKVNIIGFSMGSIITMAYIQQFGYDRIAGLALSSAALNGVSCAGEPYAGSLKFDAAGIVRYVDALTGLGDEDNLIDAVMGVLAKAGVVDTVAATLNDMADAVADRLYGELMVKTFSTLPGMWSLIPDEYYEQAKTVMLSDTETFAGLIERIDNYHYNVQKRNTDLIDGVIERGLPFGVVCKYNVQGFPNGNKPANMSDFVIDTEYSSLGATCADLDSTLGEGYTQAVDCGHNHVSPDNLIDASTCCYPEQTWFVRDFIHIDNSSAYDEILRYILFSGKQVTVFDSEQYPQFLQYDYETDTLSPLVKETPTQWEAFLAGNTWLAVIFRLLRAVFAAVGNRG